MLVMVYSYTTRNRSNKLGKHPKAFQSLILNITLLHYKFKNFADHSKMKA